MRADPDAPAHGLTNLVLALAHDANGRVTNRWTAAKGNTGYAYDALGAVTNIDYAVSTDIQLAYDANGRLIKMIDASGTNTYSYTAGGFVQSEDGPWEQDTVSYSDNGWERTGLALQRPNASPWVQSYNHDALGRLANTSTPAGLYSYTYDSTRKLLPAGLGLASGPYWTKSYDSLARLDGTFLRTAAHQLLASHEYFYDSAHRRTNQTFTAGNFIHYEYDAIGQLGAITGLEPGGTTNRWHERRTYGYDPAGNLLDRQNSALSEWEGFEYDRADQLVTAEREPTITVAGTTSSAATNVTVNGVAAALYADASFARTNVSLVNGTNTFTAIGKDAQGRIASTSVQVYLPEQAQFLYDTNGNMVSNGRLTFDWDDENQLTRITLAGGWKSEFAYDGLGRRRVRRESVWRNSAWVLAREVRYVYDGGLVIQERDGNNVPLVTYTRGKDLSGGLEGAGGIGGLIARTDHGSGESALYFSDGSGNVTGLVNSQGALQAIYRYDPFGTVLSMSGPLAEANLYRFSTKELHENSGLVYYGYRYYDPNTQRWPNRDPIGEFGGLNLYRFVYNAPLNRVDPYGLWGFQFGEGGRNWGFGAPSFVFNDNSWMDLSNGAAATLDGLIPFWDPLSDLYSYGDIWSDDQDGLSDWERDLFDKSHGAGQVAQFCLVAATPLRPFTRARQPITHFGGPLQPGSWVMTGGPTARNWLMAGGKPSWLLPGNQTVATALPGSLRWPSGWQWFKGFFGQRIWTP